MNFYKKIFIFLTVLLWFTNCGDREKITIDFADDKPTKKEAPKNWTVNIPDKNLNFSRFSDAVASNEKDGIIACGKQNNTRKLYHSKGVITKIDEAGKIVWKKLFTIGNTAPIFNSITATTDKKGYVLAGHFYDTKGDNGYVLKINYKGEKIWDKILTISNADLILRNVTEKNNQYILAGSQRGKGFGEHWVSKIYVLNENSTVEKTATFKLNVKGNKFIKAIKNTDNSFYGVGNGHTTREAQVTQIDNHLNKTWSKNFGKRGVFYDFITTTDKAVIAVGTDYKTNVNHNKGWLCKIDKTGNKIWEHFYGSEYYCVLSKIRPTKDGGFILAGIIDDNKNAIKPWLVKTDKDGNKIWEKTFQKTQSNTRFEFNSVVAIDNSYVGIGFLVYTSGAKQGVSEPFLVKYTP